MFKHTVTYLDFNDKPHTEDIYFHMMVPEFADLEFNPMFETSLSDFISTGMASGEGRRIHTVFKLLVVNSYGRRSEDGSKFTKRAEWTEEFLSSGAWEQFFIYLTDEEDGSNGQLFFNAIFPEHMRKKAQALADKEAEAGAVPKKKLTELSQAELVAMIQNQVNVPKTIDVDITQ